jgi:hypothetical protein
VELVSVPVEVRVLMVRFSGGGPGRSVGIVVLIKLK